MMVQTMSRENSSRAVHVVGEYRLAKTPDGHYYADAVYSFEFWQRYLDEFDHVIVVARVQDVVSPGDLRRVDGPKVSVYEMPHYVGFAGFMRNLLKTRGAARTAAARRGMFIFRAPGPVSTMVRDALPRQRPYGVEVVGDPKDVFRRGVVDHPLRAIIRLKSVRDLRKLVTGASAVSYVSSMRLPQRYPAEADTPTFVYSSVNVPIDFFSAEPKKFAQPLRNLVSVGSMEQRYKGFDLLIRVFSELKPFARNLNLTLVGDGVYRSELEGLARSLGVAERVTFTGKLQSAEDVRDVLEESDVYVSASRTEGLPRSIIEAQATGLPAVGTDAGGTAELLASEFVVPVDDAEALKMAILSLLDNPVTATDVARRGWLNSQNYKSDVLRAVRRDMYRSLISMGDL